MLSHLKVFHTFQLVILNPTPIATNTLRSTTTSVIPPNMNLGAKIVQAIKCRLCHAAMNAEAKVKAVWYMTKANVNCSVCPRIGIVDCGLGEIFHVDNNGMNSADSAKGPKALRITNRGEKGYVTDSNPTNADFH
jgi:hypothetical protein